MAKNSVWMLVCAGTLLAGMAFTYRPWIEDPRVERVSGPLDAWAYHGASAFYLDTMLHHGEIPQWNPLVLCGAPYAANPLSKVFYPPQFVRSALNREPTPASTHQSLRIYGIAHALLWGLSTFLLARRHGMSPLAAFVSAHVIVFSANCALRVITYNFLDVFAWLPLELLFLNLALSSPRPHRCAMYTIAAGLAIALSLLGGYPQVFVYCVLIAAIYVLGGVLLGALPGESATRPGLRRMILVLAGAGCVGLLASMALVLPAAEFYMHSARRGSAALAAESRGQFSWRAAAEILLLFRGADPFTPGLSCLSVSLLALAACAHPFRRATILFYLMIWAVVDLALGPPFPLASIANHLSPFELPATRRAVLVGTLPMALVAGLGVDALARGDIRLRSRRVFATLFALIGALLIIGAYELDLKPSLAWNPLANRSELRATVLLLPAVTVIAACVVILFRSKAAMAVLLGTVIVELGMWNSAYVEYLIKQPSMVPADMLRTSREKIDCANVRIVEDSPNVNMYALEPAIVGYEPGTVRDTWRVLAPAGSADFTRELMPVPATRDTPIGNLLVKRPFWLASTWTREKMPAKDELFPPAEVAFIDGAGPPDIPEVGAGGWSDSAIARAQAAEPMVDWEQHTDSGQVRGRLPRISTHSALRVHYESRTAGRIESRFVERSNKSLRFGWARPLDPTAGGIRTVEIPLPDSVQEEFDLTLSTEQPDAVPRVTGIDLISDAADENERLRILIWHANSIEVDLKGLPASRMLVFTDSYYPGWRAFLDGQPTPLYRADGAFKAIAVPAGDHRVVFQFSSSSVLIGVTISAVTWFVLLTLLGIFALGERRATAAAARPGSGNA